MIKSVSYDQHEILSNILELNNIDSFDADISYGNGSFYSDYIKPPELKFDIDPQCDGVSKASSCTLPLQDNAINSIVFDPPFLTHIKNGREHGSIMAKRFSGYWSYNELEKHYKETLKECYRVLNKKGILVFKCQDIIHNHKIHATHINVVNWSEGMFRLKDLFILAAKSRIGHNKKQQHARIYHSYFLVLEKLKEN